MVVGIYTRIYMIYILCCAGINSLVQFFTVTSEFCICMYIHLQNIHMLLLMWDDNAKTKKYWTQYIGRIEFKLSAIPKKNNAYYIYFSDNFMFGAMINSHLFQNEFVSVCEWGHIHTLHGITCWIEFLVFHLQTTIFLHYLDIMIFTSVYNISLST